MKKPLTQFLSIHTEKKVIANICCNHLFWILFLLVVNLLGYGAFLSHAPIYDFYNEFFPYRYSIVETIHNGCLPFWSPYQGMGTPSHADPQSGVFYLPVWIFALIFGKYTTTCCAVEFLFHTFVGACGCYLLSHHFSKNKFAAFLAGNCYMLCGFFVGNAQHLPWIIAAAWIPWVIFAFISLLEKPGCIPMLLFPLTFSLMFTGGYPAFIFILFYFLLILFVFFIIRHTTYCKTYTKQSVYYLLGAFVLTLFFSAPALISFWEIQSQITRGAALTFEDTGLPVTLQSLISLCFPYLACSDPSFTHTDISMGSIFIGLFTLPMIIIGLKEQKTPLLWVFFALAICNLLLAFGQAIPTNKIVFNYIPLLGFLRLPAAYRIFFIVLILPIAAIGFRSFIKQPSAYRRPLFYLFTTLCIIFIATAFLFKFHETGFNAAQPWDGPQHQKVMLGIWCEAFVAGVFAIALLIFNERVLFTTLLLLIIGEGVVQANLCGPKTIYDTQVDLEKLKAVTDIVGFPIPDSTTSSAKINHERNWGFIWTNAGMFTKEVEFYSCNPVKLYRCQKLLEKYNERELPMYLPIAFFPTEIVYDTNSHFMNSDTAYTTDLRMVKHFDSQPANYEITCFRPGYVRAITESDIARPWVLCQNVYPGWEVCIDGKPAKMDTLNFTMQSVTVPVGKHTVEFRYHRPFYVWAFLLQAILSIGSAGIILWILMRESHRERIKRQNHQG